MLHNEKKPRNGTKAAVNITKISEFYQKNQFYTLSLSRYDYQNSVEYRFTNAAGPTEEPFRFLQVNGHFKGEKTVKTEKSPFALHFASFLF